MDYIDLFSCSHGSIQPRWHLSSFFAFFNSFRDKRSHRGIQIGNNELVFTPFSRFRCLQLPPERNVFWTTRSTWSYTAKLLVLLPPCLQKIFLDNVRGYNVDFAYHVLAKLVGGSRAGDRRDRFADAESDMLLRRSCWSTAIVPKLVAVVVELGQSVEG